MIAAAFLTGLDGAGPIESRLGIQTVRRLRKFGLTLTVMSGLFFAASSQGGEPPRPTETQVQLAYLYNFGKFVQWPANASASQSNFTICVLGKDPFGSALDATAAGGVIGGRSVAAKRIVDARDAATCRILFISSTENTRLKQILETLNNAPVLTVSDLPHFSRRGGMIEFQLEDKRVRFEVDLDAVQNAGLAVSSELLKVAATVKRTPRIGE